MRNASLNNFLAVVLCVIQAGVAWSGDRVLYVDAAATGANDGSSWTDAYRHLNDAVAEASTSVPAVIRVAQGTYRSTGLTGDVVLAAFHLHSGVVLEGGYAGGHEADPDARHMDRYETILSGDQAGNDVPGDDWDSPSRQDNALRVVAAYETDETAVIDGFTIVGGVRAGLRIHMASPSVYRCRFVDCGGAGVDVSNSNSVLAECAIERNGFRVENGGLLALQADLTLTDCVFTGNQGGGIHTSLGDTLDVQRCTFVDNTALLGGGIRSGGDLTARDCVFRSNQGPAIDCTGRATLTGCEFRGNSCRTLGMVLVTGPLTMAHCTFIGNSGGTIGCGGVMSFGDVLTAEHCLFAGNFSEQGPGALHCSPVTRLSNCTFVDNHGQPDAVRCASTSAEMRQCIFWDSEDAFTTSPAIMPGAVVSFSNVRGGYPGEGNIDVDPLFVEIGYWDPNGTADDSSDDIWIPGDYHLKSQAGHWDRAAESWVFDDVTSPCIDAGDPNGPLGTERFPNGGYVNLGAYGRTSEASRSYFGGPVCETQIAGDINGDGKVDDLDMDILVSHWLIDVAGTANIAPTVVLTSPEDGAEFTYPAPIVLQAEASDADGTVLIVRYRLEYRSESEASMHSTSGSNATDGWRKQINWESIHHDGTHTVWAEAVDDDGAITASDKIYVTLHPQN